MSRTELSIALSIALICSTVHAAGSVVDRPEFADLVYDPATGNVSLDGNGTLTLFSFVVANPTPGAFRTENTMFPFFDVGTNTDNELFQIGQTDPISIGFHRHDLGDVFPYGIESPSSLAEFLTLAEYGCGQACGGEFDLIVVPEPSGQLIAMITTLFAANARRRQRRGGMELSSPVGPRRMRRVPYQAT